MELFLTKKIFKTHLGFTLIELMVTIGIVVLLATITYASLNPGKRQRNARNARRWGEVNAILNAVTKYQMDNNGNISGLSLSDDIYSILGTEATATCGFTCYDGSSTIDTDNNCLNLTTPLNAYLDPFPIDPLGDGSVVAQGVNGWDEARTGYWLKYYSSNGKIEIGACEPEDPDGGSGYPEIEVSIL